MVRRRRDEREKIKWKLGESRIKSVARRRRDVREIIGKRENKIEVGESRTKSVVREITGKRE